MKKSEFFETYEKYKDYPSLMVSLFMHMPDGSVEIIYSFNAHEKMKYIEQTYDDNLVHVNSPDIYITRAYFKASFDFGYALQLLKSGQKVTRDAWDNDDVYIYYVPEGNYEPCTEVGKECVNEDGRVPYGEYLAIKNKDGMVYPYIPGMDSILADDWTVIESD